MSHFKRPRENRDGKLIYIYTEGEKTEPNYFNSKKAALRISSIQVKGTGRNTRNLVDHIIKEKSGNLNGDEYRVVMDKDSFPKDHFNSAIDKAQANGINVAYSNECFELRYLLHFHYHNTKMNRKDYEKKLTGELTKIHGSKKNYKKNSEDIYQYIENLEGTAINNADKLKKEHEILGKKWADKEPSTTVHELIQRINGLTV